MTRAFKFFLLLVFIGCLLYLTLLAVYFSYPEKFIQQKPANFSILNRQRVEVELFIPVLPGLKWEFKRVQVDGVSFPFDYFKGNWRKKADFILPEGKHCVQIVGLLELMGKYKKTVSFNHNYYLDVTPPFFKVAHSLKENIYYPTSTWNLEAKTEPLSSVYIFSPTSHSYLLKSDENGKVTGEVFLASGKNDLVIKVFDQAGNTSVFRKRVFVDPISPTIGLVSPAPGELYQASSVYLRVAVSDNLALRGGSFSVNGKPLKASLEPDGKTLVSALPLTQDGTYTVRAKVKDLAGNTAVKKWSFCLDTTFIIVDLSERRLYLYRNGKVIRTYRVAVGRFDFPTPVGDWKIIAKRRNPVWRNPHMNWSKDMPEFIPPGPNNPLGPRALDLSAPLVRIHGTPQIGSIGHAASHGCIRMYPWNVIELFELVKVGTPVKIRW